MTLSRHLVYKKLTWHKKMVLNGSRPVQDFLTLISCISSNFHNDVIFTIAFARQIIQCIEIMSGIVCYFKNLNNKHHEQ